MGPTEEADFHNISNEDGFAFMPRLHFFQCFIRVNSLVVVF